jgi:hypothetical protein
VQRLEVVLDADPERGRALHERHIDPNTLTPERNGPKPVYRASGSSSMDPDPKGQGVAGEGFEALRTVTKIPVTGRALPHKGSERHGRRPGACRRASGASAPDALLVPGRHPGLGLPRRGPAPVDLRRNPPCRAGCKGGVPRAGLPIWEPPRIARHDKRVHRPYLVNSRSAVSRKPFMSKEPLLAITTEAIMDVG